MSVFLAYNMSQSGLGTVSSLEDDMRPIYGQFDSEGWVPGLRDYVTLMKGRFPAEDHPSEDWLSQGFEMILLDQGRTVASTPKQGLLVSVGRSLKDQPQLPPFNCLLCKGTWMSRLLVWLTLSLALSRRINLNG